MNSIRKIQFFRPYIKRYFTIPYHSRKSSNIAQSADPWRLRTRVIATSAGRFAHRLHGIEFNVSYIDSGADWHVSEKEKSPVVLAVHGLPADHNDMLPIVVPLQDMGCRVIVLNLPGFLLTKTLNPEDEAFFYHSTGEIVEFMVTFLRNMRIGKVDVLVAHSAGVLPSVVLSAVSDTVKSLFAVCSFPGHEAPGTSMPRLGWLHKLVIQGYGSSLGRFFLRPIVKYGNKATVNFRGEPEHFVNVLSFVVNANFDLVVSMAQELEMKKLPLTFAFSRNDKVMAFKQNLKWANFLGLEEEHMDEYDSEYNLCKEALDSIHPNRKGVILQKGGHYPQFKKDTALPILIDEARKLVQISSQYKRNEQMKSS